MNSIKSQAKSAKIKKFLYFIVGIMATVTSIFAYLTIQNSLSIDNIINNQANTEFGKLYLDAIKKQPVFITLPNADRIQAIVEDYTKTESIWSIVSKTHSIPIDYIPSDIVIPDILTRTDKSDQERSVRSDIKKPVEDMFNAASEAGFELMIGSGYRSANLQSVYFYSLANSIGETAANQSIARPGESEHQTGLAIDISTANKECYLEDCFAYTNGGEWLSDNAHKYGFILRYPEGKEDITGYRYESWHYRYVGIPLATAIYQSGLTFDETWPYLESALTTLKLHKTIQ